ncbi:uncharacterized protein BCR38DRAFT_527465 [Pseudomassariella vexata]|uniref:Uncharacterized protein n=1 Tax=Pseudomassariella vexata TaxID=1141098 RepID=A0A1Y2DGN0_9PEZI|nr:uncharacterized protein BCR38DRAFT_527465 [Pseudomassariella vexata]ORY58408.1 hypothetical protein BCR38DRAFT_527465 [Pseudomassariella vexata]
MRKQKALQMVHSQRLMKPLTRSETAHDSFPLEQDTVRVPSCLGFSIASDEKQEGPTFNYARLFTWWHVANVIHDAFEKTVANLDQERIGSADLKYEELGVKGDVLIVSQYCGLAGLAENCGTRIVPRHVNEYRQWDQLDTSFYHRIIIAILMAGFV